MWPLPVWQLLFSDVEPVVSVITGEQEEEFPDLGQVVAAQKSRFQKIPLVYLTDSTLVFIGLLGYLPKKSVGKKPD